MDNLYTYCCKIFAFQARLGKAAGLLVASTDSRGLSALTSLTTAVGAGFAREMLELREVVP